MINSMLISTLYYPGKTSLWIPQNYQIKSSDYFSNENLFRHSIVINSIHHISYDINSENGLSSLNVKYNFHKYPRHFYY